MAPAPIAANPRPKAVGPSVRILARPASSPTKQPIVAPRAPVPPTPPQLGNAPSIDSFDPDSDSIQSMLNRQSADLSPSTLPDLDSDEGPFGSASPTPEPGRPPAPAIAPTAGTNQPAVPAVQNAASGGIDLDFEFDAGGGVSASPPETFAAPDSSTKSPPADLFSDLAPPSSRSPRSLLTNDSPSNPDLSFFDDAGPPPALPPGPALDAPIPPRGGPPPARELELATERPVASAPGPFFGTPASAKPRRIIIPQAREVPSVARVLARGFFVLLFVVASLGAFVMFKNGWKFTGDIPGMIAKAFNSSNVTRLGGSNVGSDVSIGPVHRSIYENAFGRRLLIVGGSIEFTKRKPQSVVVKLVDHDSKLIAEKETILGRVFTAGELNRISDARSLEEAFARLRANEWGEVPMVGDGAFMAVFMPVPEGVENRPVWNEIDVVMGATGRPR